MDFSRRCSSSYDAFNSNRKAMDDCLIAFKMNGESLRPEQGYPVRLVVPGWEGNMWVNGLEELK